MMVKHVSQYPYTIVLCFCENNSFSWNQCSCVVHAEQDVQWKIQILSLKNLLTRSHESRPGAKNVVMFRAGLCDSRAIRILLYYDLSLFLPLWSALFPSFRSHSGVAPHTVLVLFRTVTPKILVTVLQTKLMASLASIITRRDAQP